MRMDYTLVNYQPSTEPKIRRQVIKDSITVVGLDVHKNSIEIVTADADGAMEVRRFGIPAFAGMLALFSHCDTASSLGLNLFHFMREGSHSASCGKIISKMVVTTNAVTRMLVPL